MKKPPAGIPLIALLGGDIPAERQRFERGLRSELDNNKRLTSEQRAELERYLANPIRAAAQDLQQTSDEIRQLLDAHRGGRKVGSLSEATKHIRTLAAENPGLNWLSLYTRADKSILGGMAKGTFRNKVSAARKK